MIIDATTFFNEFDMLAVRLKILSPLVDRFIIVESDKTFSGQDKPYYSDHFDKRFDEYRDKLIVYKMKVNTHGLRLETKPTFVDLSSDWWQIEYQQRNAIRDAIAETCKECPASASILIGDVDEIPSREALQWAVNNNVGQDPAFSSVPFQMVVFYYNLKFLRNEVWHGTLITNMRTLHSRGAQQLRVDRSYQQPIAHGGWHLSYFGSPEQIRRKIESFSHQELAREEFVNPAHVKQCIASGRDLFMRGVGVVPVTPECFPDYFRHAVGDLTWW
jgi:beta-1,4-mannosyl-glycoprotein beta-1,4-N-acetylglucosaminyltransferase